jgi:hypothetical protein
VPERHATERRFLEVGDYLGGKDGSVWKVTREVERDSKRYLGAESPGREPAIFEADETPVTRLIYGAPAPTEEEAVATVAAELGGKVLVESAWGPDDTVSYFHPPYDALLDPDLMRAHLVRFHGITGVDSELDLVIAHRADHQAGRADHNHGE